ncbi:phycobiliprotein lyase [Tychonema sp. LEGE 06208]|uniref:phycobiliprotein lyase n=1 Tax=Tychonema sp. LEGE 06208 TaxID=1828663 RepID=UPI001880A432|nr:phycobiliprotein lyase [Tychonema sp. LEGE 06208]MBE9162705.1 phycobiliprotein lyase [Tychonema sp. LEGE 06208]
MDVIEFFELSAGKWFSQRTVHNLQSGELQAGKSDLKIEMVTASDAAIVKLCQQHSINPTSTQLKGVRISWDGIPDRNQAKQIGSTILAIVPNPDNPREGQVLQEKGNARYVMGDDDVLTLITESDTVRAEERLWYLMPNLRLRTSVVKQANGTQQASFCSEIRMGVTAKS